jgi:EAL domain-containing protein (putative c-di-GMP-specific phosphodiesterase class I)/GGDEF domain-containing protein
MADNRKPGLFKRLTEALFEEVEQPEEVVVAPEPPPEPEPEPEPPPKPVDTRPDIVGDAPPRARVDTDQMRPALPPLPETLHSPAEMAVATADFQERLNKVLAGDAPVIAGRMQFLQLDDIKAHFGDKWAEMAKKAYTIAEQVINNRLSPTDVCAPYDDENYIILFAELTEEQARLKAGAIAREVREKLLGEFGIDDRNWGKAFVGDIKPLVGKPGETLTIAEIGKKLGETEDVTPPPVSGADAELQRRVGEVGIVYRPTWYSAKKVISIFDTRAIRLDRLNKLWMGAHAYGKVDPAVAFEIDRLVLQRAIRDIRKVAAANGRAVVQVPIHLQSLLAHSRDQLVDFLRMQPTEIRHLLVIELAGLSPSLLAHIWEAVTAIQPFCRAMTIRVPLGFTDLERIARLKIISVGIDLDTPEVTQPLEEIVQQLTFFVKRAHQLKLTSHLYGVNKRATLNAVRDLGFDYLNGTAVAAEVGKPANAYGYEPAH